ncbi:Nucleoporin GLE1 [Sergentomyia squamirostris]
MFSKSSISFDEKPLRQSILLNAARISPQCQTTTIGPNADITFLEDAMNTLVIANGDSDKNATSPDSDTVKSPPKINTNLKDYFDDISHVRKRQNIERHRRETIQKELLCRLNRQKLQQTDLEAIYSESQKNLQRKLTAQYEEAERRIQVALAEQEKLSRIQEEKLKEAMVANNKRINSQQMKLKQFQEKQKIAEMRKWQEIFVKCFETFAHTLMNIDKNLLPNYLPFNERAKHLMTAYDQIIKAISAGNISDTFVTTIESLVKDFQCLQEELNEKIVSDAAEVERAKQKPVKEEAPPKVEKKPSVDQPDAVRVVEGLSQFISPESQKTYKKVMNLYVEYTIAVDPLTRDDSLKKFRFNCQKAINIPVNAISGVSSAHLRDKYDKLFTLLSGNSVSCGDEQVNAAAHPLGTKFCTLLLAKKFVNQADTTVASNPKAAFPMAAVIVALWQKFSDFGDLFLANAYKDCPYLVPYFIPQFEEQSSEDYCKVLGYKITNGTLEPQDMYLKRMAGIARLYAAILVTIPRQGETQSHPHGLHNGWMWLCNMLNMDPLPDICATMLLEVLQIVGEEMRRSYTKQFLKLLHVLVNQYYPKLKQIDEGGPRVRLEVVLVKVMKDGIFDKPDGVLHPNFW